MKLKINGVETIEITDPRGACDTVFPRQGLPAGQPQIPLPSQQPGYIPPAPTIVPQIPGPFTPFPQPDSGHPLPWSKWTSGGYQTTGGVEPDEWRKNLNLSMAAEEIEGKDDDGHTVFK